MENKEESAKRNVLLYAIYTSVYVNDLVCASILELEKFVKERDKETKKIYGALARRSIEYQRNQNKLYGSSSEQVAAYNLYCDKIIYPKFESYRKSIQNIYKRNQVEDYEFLSYVEAFRSMAEMSVNIIDAIIRKSWNVGVNAYNLESYKLEDIKRISDNFSKWTYRHFKSKNVVNLPSKKSVTDAFRKLYSALCSYDVFEKGYEIAFKI